LLKKLGIPQCGFHAFRHGNATLLDQIGAPMAVWLNRLWHAEAQTTMGYTHAAPLMNAELQRHLRKFCTDLHEMNKTKGQRRSR